MLSIYVHAFYYVLGTVSHVAIGDITAVNPKEFLANTIFGWVGTFIYCLLFADITSLVSELQSKSYKKYITQRNYVISKLKSRTIPVSVVAEADRYLAYTFDVHEGYTQEEILEEIPLDLRSFFMMARYKELAT
jgi:hypothetical protein